MLTYREFFNRMSAIFSAFNDAVNSASVVRLQGLSDQEDILYKAGLYVISMSKSEYSVFSKESVGYLIQLCKYIDGSFELGIFPPDDIEDNPEFEEEWRTRFNSYARMRKRNFIGSCFTFDPIIDYNGKCDLQFWCSQQAEHLAEYCVSHDLDCDLLKILCNR